MSDDPLKNFAEGWFPDDPELQAIQYKLKVKEITGDQAFDLMEQYIQEREDASVSSGVQTEIPQRASQELAVPEGEEILPPDGPLCMFKPSSMELPRLNPLVEGALIERVQFDGDIPELRTGPLPRKTLPAVSVKTTARDPVAMGVMLDTAAKRVGGEVRKQDKQLKADIVEKMLSHTEIIKKTDDGGELALQGSAETDAPAYKRGQLPDLVRTRRPSGSALANLTPEERKGKAFKFFSTTQGRRSAVLTIRELVAVALRSEDWEVEERDFDPRALRETPLAHHEWSVSLSGAGATQATFSVIDVAARALAKSLVKQLAELEPLKRVILEVSPVNTTDVRAVGWAARVLGHAKISLC